MARACGADYCVLKKQRLGDRDVRVAPEGLKPLGARTPVLVDDIISSGKTVQQAITAIAPFSRRPPVVLAVHGVFSDGADTALERAGAQSRQLGAGIFDLIPAFELGDRTLHSMSLFASKVLPQLRDSDHV